MKEEDAQKLPLYIQNNFKNVALWYNQVLWFEMMFLLKLNTYMMFTFFQDRLILLLVGNAVNIGL